MRCNEVVTFPARTRAERWITPFLLRPGLRGYAQSAFARGPNRLLDLGPEIPLEPTEPRAKLIPEANGNLLLLQDTRTFLIDADGCV